MDTRGSNPDIPNPLEQRRGERIPQAQRMEIWLYYNGQLQPPIEVELRDFSDRGVGFVHNEPLYRGEQFLIRVAGSGQDARLLYTVAHARRESVNSYLIGCEYTCMMPVEVESEAWALQRFHDAIVNTPSSHSSAYAA